MSVHTPPVGQFVPIPTFSYDQNPGDLTKRLTQIFSCYFTQTNQHLNVGDQNFSQLITGRVNNSNHSLACGKDRPISSHEQTYNAN